MGYKGQTYRISTGVGGLYLTDNRETAPAQMMIDGTKNLNLHTDGRENRGGTSKKVTGHGSAQIMGGIDFTLENGTQYNVVATSDGKLWSDGTTEIQDTTLTINKFTSFTVYNNMLLICNGADTPRVLT